MALIDLYRKLRKDGLDHKTAFRVVLIYSRKRKEAQS